MLRSRQETSEKNTDWCEMIGNPIRLPSLSKVAVVPLFASLSYALLTERFAVSTSILQVHLNKTLVGFQVPTSFSKCCSCHWHNPRAYRCPWTAITQSITLSRGTFTGECCNRQFWVKPKEVLLPRISEGCTLCLSTQALWRSHYWTQRKRGEEGEYVQPHLNILVARPE